MKGKMDFVQTEKWKSFMAYLYGWGASLVIVGALFKLMHWPGAGVMLTIGMSTEAIIFFFSAFEPPHEEYDWKLVFPELAIKDEETLELIRNERKSSSVQVGNNVPAAPAAASAPRGGGPGSTQVSGGNVNIPNIDISIDKSSLDNVNKGLSNLAEAANKIADITQVTLSVNELSEKLQRASVGVDTFNEQVSGSSEQLGKSVSDLSQAYLHGMDKVSEAGETLVNGVKGATESLAKSLGESASALNVHFDKAGSVVESTITGSSKELASKITDSSNLLSDAFDRISKQVLADMEVVKAGNGNQQKNLETLNKSLATLNSVYEIQIQETDSHLKNANVLYKDVEGLVKDLRQSVDETQKFKQSLHSLNENINSLNDIYGNMLSAMHSIHNN